MFEGDHPPFPFEVERVVDNGACFADVAGREPVRAGHTFVLLGIEMEDEACGVMVKVREGSGWVTCRGAMSG